jgi:hypothetical protein
MLKDKVGMVSFICIVITIVQFYLFIILISIYFPLKPLY